jgi:hypothetical protein
MNVKISELCGAQLDYAVAKCEGLSDSAYMPLHNEGFSIVLADGVIFTPSRDWHQGGPIIECIGGFELKIWLESTPETQCEAHIHNYDGDWIAFGPTPLIAAMRCYVASKMGDEVDIPEELK